MKLKKDEYKKHSCDLKNEDECEEEMEEEGLELDEVEKEHYDESEEGGVL